MEVYIILPSVNELLNVKSFEFLSFDSDCKLVIIDENNSNLRKKNDKLLGSLQHEYYGPREREKWFKERFGSGYRKYLSVIPERCHAESSFGFLLAYENCPDMIIEIDDDVYPVKDQNIIRMHWRNLTEKNCVTVKSRMNWYNTLENLKLNSRGVVFPRGHPYTPTARTENYSWKNGGSSCVLNMGMWTGCPDLDAMTVLYQGGLNGRCQITATVNKRDKIIVDKGTFFAVCSMNTAFIPKIVPAFYQLYMNCMNIDRFDDIWSGLFLKKVVDRLNDKICLGVPLVYHDKRPRDTFKNLKAELEGMAINERLWQMVDKIELDEKSYLDAYISLIHGLSDQVAKAFSSVTHQKFMGIQLKKMMLWTKIIDKLS